MAITIKYDLLGSSLTKGVTSNMYDRARVRAYIEGIENTNLGVGDAIDEIIADTPRRFHQHVGNLPLAHVSARRHGKTSAIAELVYGRRNVSIPSQPPLKIANFRTTRWAVEWFRLPYTASGLSAFAGTGGLFPNSPNGIPNGTLQFYNGGFGDTVGDITMIPKPWVFSQSAIRMYVPTVLDFNPLERVAFRLDTINNGAVTFGGFTFNPYTLMFDGIEVDWIDTPQGVRFVVNYTFLAVRVGFVKQNAYFDPAQFGGVWVTKTALSHQATSFTSPAFPYNNNPLLP